ncbi:zf-HC2 domain-containing protein [Allobaculum sp. Allo2]|uniref:zf-HC2 domain-containing protein n=1 Tax=Allobaculum sp. Allo2 TaxID=2853432 RepID=UPI001F60C034|nr:zf-HC2 domain-containing protein [Allobaculum sp. Allo2]UNT92383.1 zf-HC2 domain-containing protein [Allobaculum sp. Allo2]
MMNLPENNPDKRNANTENSMNMETAFDKEFVDSNTQCELVQDLLPLYVEGLTSPLSSAFIQRHIDQCPKCKAEWDAMRQPVPEIPDVQDIPVKTP